MTHGTACIFKVDISMQFKIRRLNGTHLQILARRSPLPVANSSPDGLGATDITGRASAMQHPKTCRKRTGVLVSLKHQLGHASPWVPELDPSVLGAAEDPLVIRSKCNTKHKVLNRLDTRNMGK